MTGAMPDELITGRENLEMVWRLNRIGSARPRTRARDLLERFELTDAAERTVTQ